MGFNGLSNLIKGHPHCKQLSKGSVYLSYCTKLTRVGVLFSIDRFIEYSYIII